MSNNKNILIINGPNLNLLGGREKDIYGQDSLQDIENKCREKSSKLGLEIDFFQSNSESELVDKIQNSKNNTDLVIINAAAYTHTSVAIHDALRAIDKPIIEVHLSNIYKREEFRHKSYISPIAEGVICGFGTNSYLLAIEASKDILS
jgi:3-dehydroquinate dehydratase-2